jgi:hypothetical protein
LRAVTVTSRSWLQSNRARPERSRLQGYPDRRRQCEPGSRGGPSVLTRRALLGGLALRALAVLALAAGLAGAVHGLPRGIEPAAQIQATYLVNFIRYTEWPDDHRRSPAAPILIAVAGPTWLATTVRAVARATGPIRQRPLQVRRLRLPRSARALPDDVRRDLRAAHVLFIHTSYAPLQPLLLQAVGGQPVLTVGTDQGFTAAGGMLGLWQADHDIVFGANPDSIRSSGLMISAKLLKLSRDDTGERR